MIGIINLDLLSALQLSSEKTAEPELSSAESHGAFHDVITSLGVRPLPSEELSGVSQEIVVVKDGAQTLPPDFASQPFEETSVDIAEAATVLLSEEAISPPHLPEEPSLSSIEDSENSDAPPENSAEPHAASPLPILATVDRSPIPAPSAILLSERMNVHLTANDQFRMPDITPMPPAVVVAGDSPPSISTIERANTVFGGAQVPSVAQAEPTGLISNAQAPLGTESLPIVPDGQALSPQRHDTRNELALPSFTTHNPPIEIATVSESFTPEEFARSAPAAGESAADLPSAQSGQPFVAAESAEIARRSIPSRPPLIQLVPIEQGKNQTGSPISQRPVTDETVSQTPSQNSSSQTPNMVAEKAAPVPSSRTSLTEPMEPNPEPSTSSPRERVTSGSAASIPASPPLEAQRPPDFAPLTTVNETTSPQELLGEPESFQLEPLGNAAPATAREVMAAKPDLARTIAQQIINAAPQEPNRPIELVLSPEELGRVRLMLQPTDQGMTLAIVAERPETLELMRRNVDALAQDFQAIGYESTAFSFAQSHSDGSGSDQRETPQPTVATHIDQEKIQPIAPPLAYHIASADRVDYRI